MHTHTAGGGPGVRREALSANVKCYLFRETFHSLSLASKDFGPKTIVFPSLMNSDALLPDWSDVTFKKEENGNISSSSSMSLDEFFWQKFKLRLKILTCILQPCMGELRIKFLLPFLTIKNLNIVLNFNSSAFSDLLISL